VETHPLEIVNTRAFSVTNRGTKLSAGILMFIN
jgi:hypothetical protein